MKHTILTLTIASLLAATAFADPIHDAAESGNLAGVQDELDNGVDVNVKNGIGRTPLFYAAYYGQKEIAELLIDKGAVVNMKDREGWTPLHGGHKEIAELLIAEGADVNEATDYGQTILHSSAYKGHKEIAELLIAEGAVVNAKRRDGLTPLDLAIREKNTGTAILLRKHGGKTGEELLKFDRLEWPIFGLIGVIGPIHLAVTNNNIAVVKHHLAAGTDVNAKGELGETPLHDAAQAGHKEIAELLIANGADVNAKDYYYKTPLDQAISFNRTEIADLLRKHGGKTGGELPLATLHEAVIREDLRGIKDFLFKGADVNAKSALGMTPLDIANRNRKYDYADLLRIYGAKTSDELLMPSDELLMPRLVQHGRFAFSFNTFKGVIYEIQDSPNLKDWETVKTYTGTGRTLRFDEERDHDPPQWFYRVKLTE